MKLNLFFFGMALSVALGACSGSNASDLSHLQPPPGKMFGMTAQAVATACLTASDCRKPDFAECAPVTGTTTMVCLYEPCTASATCPVDRPTCDTTVGFCRNITPDRTTPPPDTQCLEDGDCLAVSDRCYVMDGPNTLGICASNNEIPCIAVMASEQQWMCSWDGVDFIGDPLCSDRMYQSVGTCASPADGGTSSPDGGVSTDGGVSVVDGGASADIVHIRFRPLASDLALTADGGGRLVQQVMLRMRNPSQNMTILIRQPAGPVMDFVVPRSGTLADGRSYTIGSSGWIFQLPLLDGQNAELGRPYYPCGRTPGTTTFGARGMIEVLNATGQVTASNPSDGGATIVIMDIDFGDNCILSLAP